MERMWLRRGLLRAGLRGRCNCIRRDFFFPVRISRSRRRVFPFRPPRTELQPRYPLEEEVFFFSVSVSVEPREVCVSSFCLFRLFLLVPALSRVEGVGHHSLFLAGGSFFLLPSLHEEDLICYTDILPYKELCSSYIHTCAPREQKTTVGSPSVGSRASSNPVQQYLAPPLLSPLPLSRTAYIDNKLFFLFFSTTQPDVDRTESVFRQRPSKG